MEDTLPARVRFGAFELDLNAGELRPAAATGDAEPGDRIVLPQQPLQVLCMLIERDGAIVTREEIREEVLAERHHCRVRSQHQCCDWQAAQGAWRLR